MDKLMQKAMEKHKIVRYKQTFIDVMTTYKSLLEAENEQLHKPVVVRGGASETKNVHRHKNDLKWDDFLDTPNTPTEQLPAEEVAQNGRVGIWDIYKPGYERYGG